MKKARILPTYLIPIVGLFILTGAFSNALADCPLPEGVMPLPEPAVTAQQVEDGSATLMDFALASRDQYRVLNQRVRTPGAIAHFGCLIRQDGGAYRSGSTYLVLLRPDGRMIWHAKAMKFSGKLLNPGIYGSILSALGVPLTDLANMASPDPAVAAQAFAAVLQTLSQEPDAAFDATTPIPGIRPGIPGASGHAAVFFSTVLRSPVVLLAGFDINETHVAEEDIDYGDPAVTAEDVVDRETLKAFVTQAGEYYIALARRKNGDLLKAKVALRDEDGPWKHRNVYIYVINRISNTIQFHGAFPDRLELRPPGVTRDAVTGELIADQIFAAAASSSEGGFWEYHFDDPTDDTDSADIPKVGYAHASSTFKPRGMTEPFSQSASSSDRVFMGAHPTTLSRLITVRK